MGAFFLPGLRAGQRAHLPRIFRATGWPAIALLSIAVLMTSNADAFAQNSLGIGRPEQAITPGDGTGFLSGVLFWIQQQQKEFYRSMTGALKLIRSGEGGTWLLAGLSFAYGVLHAAGPGHGKVVISSYMVANEVQLRRGILLAVLSSILQAIVAIAAIGAIVFLLHGLGMRQGDLQRNLEIASYAMVALLGAWLLVRKLRPLMMPVAGLAPVHAHSGAHDHGSGHFHGQAHGQAHGPVRAHARAHAQDDHHHHEHHHHDHGHDHSGEGGTCSECGHAHMPSPQELSGPFGVREAVSAVIAVGLRPCSGALIVLTFAFLNGIYLAGIFATFAMAAGTAITVSAIAILAVTAKNTAMRLAGGNGAGARFHQLVEVAGALVILLLGLTLLGAALSS